MALRSRSLFTRLSRQFSTVDASSDLHWALSKLGVVSKAKSYLNLGLQELKQVSRSGNVHQVQVGAPVSKVALDKYNYLMKKVQNDAVTKSLFVNDLSVGSFGKDAVLTRVVADNAAVSQLYRNLLFAAPSRPATKFEYSFTIFHSSLVLSEEDLKYVSATSSNILLLNASKKTLLILGQVSTADIQAAITQYISGILAPGVVLVRGKLLDDSSNLAVQSSNSANVHFWSNHGISSVFGGTLLKDTVAKEGDVVETSKSGDKAISRGAAVAANLYKAPSNVFLFWKDTTGALPTIAQLSPAQARLYFALSSSGDVATAADRFASALTNAKSNAYLINESTCTDVEKLISAVSKDGFKSATITSEPSLGFQIPSIVSGFTCKQEVNGAAALKLAEELKLKASAFPKLSLDGSFSR